MKLRITSVGSFLLGLLAVLCSGGFAFAADMDAAAKVLAKLEDECSAAAGKKDAAAVASFYAADAICYPPNSPIVVGHEAVAKVWGEMLVDPGLVSIAWKPLRADVAASGELGLTAGSYEMVLKGPDGKLVTDKGKYLCAWKKGKDGKWKMVHDMWSSDSK